uniref:Uncharacterized protein n=1 Tax=Chromera velia CCMP2878 TaxID=1169474 RepID=A0A0G4G7G1_9ALVE|eukprot:Cvel_4289.t1-p1 / transcript=Cvel_4289.t1 / gene=Cvel_4289 / organism=Chromera_velia_CCMP2878 / gene_product=hypothetical protein / transcript_product=hypothetical protein / location=Cvel_scaffold186:35644-40578(-) / protein_length=261 / sequence_SO=supercontig / SO=protein_coding / is_pseudo=false
MQALREEGEDSAALRKSLREAEDKVKDLEARIKYNTTVALKKEAALQRQVEILDRQLKDRSDGQHERRMMGIQKLHSEICQGIEVIQDHTVNILQDQEKDLMRAFRARKGTTLRSFRLRTVKETKKVLQTAQMDAEEDNLIGAAIAQKRGKQKSASTMHAATSSFSSRPHHQGGGDQLGDTRSGASTASGPMPFRGSPEGRPSPPPLDTTNNIYERELRQRNTIDKLRRSILAEKQYSAQLRSSLNRIVAGRSELEILLKQ